MRTEGEVREKMKEMERRYEEMKKTMGEGLFGAVLIGATEKAWIDALKWVLGEV